MRKATYQGYSQVRNSPATIATSPMIEPTERSMPPVMMTTVMPSAMMPKGAKLRVMLATLSTVPKLGSQDGHVGHQQRQRHRHPEGLAGEDALQHGLLLDLRDVGNGGVTGLGALRMAQAARIAPVIRPVISSGDVLAVTLVGHLRAAAQHDDAVADGENVGHAVADEDHRHALRLQAPDQFQHLRHLAHGNRGGRLVHQHQLGIGEAGAGDGHRLALAARHLAHQVARAGFGLQLGEEFGRPVDHGLLVAAPGRARRPW